MPAFTVSVQAVTLDKSFTIYLCPNTHLDTAWQHPFPEVAYSGGNNGVMPMFTRATTALSDPAYAGQLRFTTSASAHLKMLKDYYNMDNPTANQRLWDITKTLVDNGQLDLAGGQIVEPDLNVPSGESLVRQSLYAQHFFLNNFTRNGQPYKSLTGMVPDVFGFCGQLPQILMKSEIKYFVTSKVNWNNQDGGGAAIGSSYNHYRTAGGNGNRGRDSDIMTWQALDGESTVIANFLQADYNNTAPNGQIQNAFDANWVVATGNDASGFPNNRNFHGGVRSTGIKKAVLFYGGGDFGQGMSTANSGATSGGNSFRHHEYVATQSPGTLVTVKTSTVTQFFEELVATENLERLNTTDGNFIDGEIYAEFHRGTYTTWARLKKYNRDTEILAESAEKAATIGFYTNSVSSNNQQRIEDGWYKILINQMHDVLPGSSLAWQSYLTFNHYELAKNLFNGVRDNALAALAYRADTNTVGKPVFVYNDLSWARSGEVTVRLQYDAATMPEGGVVVYDGSTPIVPSNIVRSKGENRLDVTFNATNVPAIGYKVFDVRVQEPAARTTPLRFDYSTWTITNDHLIVKFNPATGYISSLQTIVDGSWKEMFAQGVGTEGGELHVYHDCDENRPSQNFDQWNVNRADLNRDPWYYFETRPVSMRVTSNTPEKVTISVTKVWNGQKVTQNFSVLADSDRVDVNLMADWYQMKRLLKVSFPIAADNNNASFETAFGAVQRPTLRGNVFGYARFEVPMHKWFDVTDNSGNWGVSILNDAKYGCDVLRQTVNGTTFVRSRITAARVPRAQAWAGNSTFPPTQPYLIDSGPQEFNYSIAPHAGSWEDAKTVNKAAEINYPMKAFEAAKGPSNGLGSSQSFAASDKSNVIITALKNQYDEPDNKNKIIVRVYESSGRPTNDVTLTLPGNILSAKEVNMLEHDFDAAHGYSGVNAYTVKPLTVSGNTVKFNIKKYEALTIECVLEPSAQTALTLPQQSIALSYNSRGVTPNSARNTSSAFIAGTGSGTSNVGLSMPQEHWPANNELDYNGIKFNLGAPNANNFLSGTETASTITVTPTQGYSKLYIVGVSVPSTGTSAVRNNPYRRDPTDGIFTVNYATGAPTEKEITFNSWRTELSGWNRTAFMDVEPYVTDTIIHFNGHYHLHTGNNGEMHEADNYLFLYSIDLDKARTVTSIEIPVSSNIKIAAMTLADPVDGFGITHVSSGDVDEDFYWDISDLAPNSNTGTAYERSNIAGPLDATGHRAFTAISSSGQTGTGGEGFAQILTNNGSSKWCGTSTTLNNAWWVMDAGAQVKLPGYVIRGANDDMSYPERVLHTWTVYGSNSASGPWNTVVSAPGAQGTGWTSNYQTRVFLFDSDSIPDTGFRYYRLQITRRANTANGTALSTSNTTMQFSYFGLVTGYTENGTLTARVNHTKSTQSGTVSLATLNGLNYITLNGNLASSVAAPVAAKTFTTVKNNAYVKIYPDTKLAYMINPSDSFSAYSSIDVRFSDGTRLSALNPVDQHGIGITPLAQGAGNKLIPGTWNYVETEIGKVADGKIITEISFCFETLNGVPGQRVETSLDNVMVFTGDRVYDDNLCIYAAVYKANGVMTSVKVFDAAMYAFGAVTFDPAIVLDASTAGAGSYVKVFYWTKDGFIPVTDPDEF